MIAKAGSARTLAAVLGLLALAALFAWLGAWQLTRAETSRAALAQFASGAADRVLASLPLVLADDLRFRRVEIDGEYVAEPQFLLDTAARRRRRLSGADRRCACPVPTSACS